MLLQRARTRFQSIEVFSRLVHMTREKYDTHAARALSAFCLVLKFQEFQVELEVE